MLTSLLFKAPILFAIIYVLITLFLVIFAFVAAPTESLLGVAIICTGIPVYIIGCVWKNKPKSFQRKFGKSLILYVIILFKLYI
uniref:Large neutral amino acids transporter small subunit 2 n=1 Tax=Schistosoma haematobium TaxID=6185 RepID=A0A095C198_SCHHA